MSRHYTTGAVFGCRLQELTGDADVLFHVTDFGRWGGVTGIGGGAEHVGGLCPPGTAGHICCFCRDSDGLSIARKGSWAYADPISVRPWGGLLNT
jgi:hypothetical protein